MTRMWWPTIIYTETHNVECVCGACNNTTCQATIRVEPCSQQEYEAAIKEAVRRSGWPINA